MVLKIVTNDLSWREFGGHFAVSNRIDNQMTQAVRWNRLCCSRYNNPKRLKAA
jgi:hypothetical protein